VRYRQNFGFDLISLISSKFYFYNHGFFWHRILRLISLFYLHRNSIFSPNRFKLRTVAQKAFFTSPKYFFVDFNYLSEARFTVTSRNNVFCFKYENVSVFGILGSLANAMRSVPCSVTERRAPAESRTEHGTNVECGLRKDPGPGVERTSRRTHRHWHSLLILSLNGHSVTDIIT